MRTTLILDDRLFRQIKKSVSARRISEFVNRCVEEHFERLERERREQELEQSYARAAGGADDFDSIEVEDWPQ